MSLILFKSGDACGHGGNIFMGGRYIEREREGVYPARSSAPRLLLLLLPLLRLVVVRLSRGRTKPFFCDNLPQRVKSRGTRWKQPRKAKSTTF